ncbi:MAG: hypothetical protein ACREQM_07230 [Candidatus Dormibacteraceae bacterium]
MTAGPVDAIARAVLYEGYLLYPYTRSATKNQVRWTFGGVYPPAWAADPSLMQSECLVWAGPGCRLQATVRCLQLVERTAPGEAPWQEAAERTVADLEVVPAELGAGRLRVPIDLPAGREQEDGTVRIWRRIEGWVSVQLWAVERDALRLRVRVENTTQMGPDPARDIALLSALVSAHVVLRAQGGRFISLADPPPPLREAAAACDNRGTWPVLVGEPGSADLMLSSPIVLEDYPRVAEESAGDLFDATEIDEILTLRILTLSDAEKAELRRTDRRAAALLQRTEALGADELMRLHGTLRQPRLDVAADPIAGLAVWGESDQLTQVAWAFGELHVGDAVRLQPGAGADIMDLALRGRTAQVESIVQDFEDRVQVAVVLDDDPGADLGQQRLPGHRFFFQLSEVAPA